MKNASGWAELLRGGLFARFALLILGVWLNAADTLVTVTIMPSVAQGVGGYAYFGWATAVFLLGAMTAGATAGLFGQRLGLRAAMSGAGGLYAAGCVLGAASPGIALFLIARLAQGLGAGWIVGLVFVAVGSTFPAAQWARAMAATTSVWGAATLLGPLLGGLFAAAGPQGWRGVFWFFALQGAAFSGAAWRLLPRRALEEPIWRTPLRQIVLVIAGVAAIGLAGVGGDLAGAAVLTAMGLMLLGLALRIDARAPSSLLPRLAGDLRSPAGAGYLTIFLLEAGCSGWSVYGAAATQAVYGVNPLIAGYVVGCVAVGWTVCALLIAGLAGHRHADLIRLGAWAVLFGILALAASVGRAPLAALAAAAGLLGAGFGLSWSFMGRRILAALPEAERGLGAGAIPTVQMIGAAAGAAAAGALGDRLGLRDGVDRSVALKAAPILFAAFAPLAVGGVWAAHRLARFDPPDPDETEVRLNERRPALKHRPEKSLAPSEPGG